MSGSKSEMVPALVTGGALVQLGGDGGRQTPITELRPPAAARTSVVDAAANAAGFSSAAEALDHD